MVAGVHRANHDLLLRLFSGLFYFGVFPACWKHAKCVRIPKPGKTDSSDPKRHRPISLLSCLGKTYEKILAARLAHAGRETGAISKEQFGSQAHCLSIDQLIVNLTKAQTWTRAKVAYGKHTLRPTMLGNDIDSAFNCVVHSHLTDIHTHYYFPKYLVQSVNAFNENRTVALAFDPE